MNPALLGCYVPRIPGKADPAVVTPVWDSYTCFQTPDSILNRVVASAVDYQGPSVTRAATFVATATSTASQADWILYACFGQDYVDWSLVAGYATAPDSTWTAANPLTPAGCAAYCESAAGGPYDYAALAGVAATNGQRCYCAKGLGTVNTRGPTLIQDCNQPCAGNDQQMCGGVNGPIVYARPALAGLGQYVLNATSYARTPVYSCTETGMYFPFSLSFS